MTEAERYGEFRSRLMAASRAIATVRDLLERCQGALLPPPDCVNGPEAGECVAMWGMDYGPWQFTVTVRGGYSMVWGDLRPAGVDSGEAKGIVVVIDRLAEHLKAKDVAGG